MPLLGLVQTRGFTDGYTVGMGIENQLFSFVYFDQVVSEYSL